MGMAASQARYLSLVARKTNCEYEGQQINQARTALANQSANLFNQMLGLQVPVPPSTQDFSKTQYSFTDGINPAVIDKWEQLASPDDDGYNYVVEYHYEASVYKGFQKKMNDPQIIFSYSVPSDETIITDQKETVDKIYEAQETLRNAQAAFDTANNEYNAMLTKAKSLVSYRDRTTFTDKIMSTATSGSTTQFVLKPSSGSGETMRFTSFKDIVGYSTMEEAKANYSSLSGDKKIAYDIVAAWISDGIEIDESNIYFTTNSSRQLVSATNMSSRTSSSSGTINNPPGIALLSDLENMSGVSGNSTTLPLYKAGNSSDTSTDPYTIYSMLSTINNLKTEAENKLELVKNAENDLESLNMPEYVGNSKLTSLGELSKEQLAEIKQIMRTLDEQGADTTKLYKCFESSLNITEDNYIGGIYSFERDGVTYYTTYYDLADTAIGSQFMNDIDNQPKLNYYHASYITENIEKTDKAVLDTDSKGRFKTVKFKDGSQYTLNFETVTDDEAYQDAMNKYYYENARYDKMIQDLNAKTSIIQQEDRTLELRLKQLDTEQSALSSEIDAVSKVVKDNVDKSFKTFGG